QPRPVSPVVALKALSQALVGLWILEKLDTHQIPRARKCTQSSNWNIRVIHPHLPRFTSITIATSA
ncbi:MAG: hypothetical protein L7U64_02025, partial [Luminiphilus sp.]|nr:hypothetical protein [Luminiphilus sp.]